jgi:hypothetical protein
MQFSPYLESVFLMILHDIFLYISLCTDVWKLLSQRIFEFIHYANYDDFRKECVLIVSEFWFTCSFAGYGSITCVDKVLQTKSFLSTPKNIFMTYKATCFVN